MSFVRDGLQLNSSPTHCVYANAFTSYLPLSGDMPPVIALNYGNDVVVNFDLANFLSLEQLSDFKARSERMPRLKLNEMLAQIAKSISDADLQEAVTTNLLELFNQENQKMIAQSGLDVWTYEQAKMEAIYQTIAEQDLTSMNVDALTLEVLDQKIANNQRAELEQRYTMLAPLNDPAFELQRAIAFKLLLDKEAFASAKMVLEFYETLSEDMKRIINSTT